MGGAASRQEEEPAVEGAYRYPPAEGLYFGDSMTVGGEQFAALDPEAFLFGDMQELNLLAPLPGEPLPSARTIHHTNTIRSLLNMRKDSLRLIQRFEGRDPLEEYNVEFLYDCDVPCKISVIAFAEEVSDRNGRLSYKPSSSIRAAKVFSSNVNAGVKQRFVVPEPIRFLEQQRREDLHFAVGSSALPLVIVMDASSVDATTVAQLLQSTDNDTDVDDISCGVHMHVSIATFEQRHQGAPFTARVLVQKLNAGGASYLLKEIYGIERRIEDEGTASPASPVSVDAAAESAAIADENKDCVVCMSETRDTIVLPCRHLCLCQSCAEVLRFQSSFCPICRANFNALLQIRALRPANGPAAGSDSASPLPEEDERVPEGFRSVSIVDALSDEPPAPMLAFGGNEYLEVTDSDTGATSTAGAAAAAQTNGGAGAGAASAQTDTVAAATPAAAAAAASATAVKANPPFSDEKDVRELSFLPDLAAPAELSEGAAAQTFETADDDDDGANGGDGDGDDGASSPPGAAAAE